MKYSTSPIDSTGQILTHWQDKNKDVQRRLAEARTSIQPLQTIAEGWRLDVEDVDKAVEDVRILMVSLQEQSAAWHQQYENAKRAADEAQASIAPLTEQAAQVTIALAAAERSVARMMKSQERRNKTN